MLLYFEHCLLAVYNLQPRHIFPYFLYIGLVVSNIFRCNRVPHTPTIKLFHRNKPLFHPWKISPNHVMTMEQFGLSFRLHKNPCLFKEDPWVPIVSLYVCTSRAPRCRLCSHDHTNMIPLSQEKNPCIYGIFF